KALVRAVVSRSTGDDPVEVLWVALCFHECLASAAGATNKIRETRRRGICGGNDRLALDCRFVNGAVAKIDQFLRMPHGELRCITDVPRVRGRSGVSATQRGSERRILDRASPTAIAD